MVFSGNAITHHQVDADSLLSRLYWTCFSRTVILASGPRSEGSWLQVVGEASRLRHQHKHLMETTQCRWILELAGLFEE